MAHLADKRITQFTTLSDELVSAVTDLLEQHTDYKYEALDAGGEAYLDFKHRRASDLIEAIVDAWVDTHNEYTGVDE